MGIFGRGGSFRWGGSSHSVSFGKVSNSRFTIGGSTEEDDD